MPRNSMYSDEEMDEIENPDRKIFDPDMLELFANQQKADAGPDDGDAKMAALSNMKKAVSSDEAGGDVGGDDEGMSMKGLAMRALKSKSKGKGGGGMGGMDISSLMSMFGNMGGGM